MSAIPGKVLRRYGQLQRRLRFAHLDNDQERAAAERKIADLDKRYPGLREAYLHDIAKKAAQERTKASPPPPPTPAQGGQGATATAPWHTGPRAQRRQWSATAEFVELMQAWGGELRQESVVTLLRTFERGVDGVLETFFDGASDLVHTYLSGRSAMPSAQPGGLDRGALDWIDLWIDDEDAAQDKLFDCVAVDVDNVQISSGDYEVGDLIEIPLTLPVGLFEAVAGSDPSEEVCTLAHAILVEAIAELGGE